MYRVGGARAVCIGPLQRDGLEAATGWKPTTASPAVMTSSNAI